jgi:hypothetical protein
MNLFILFAWLLAVSASVPIRTFNDALKVVKSGNSEDEAKLIAAIKSGNEGILTSLTGTNSLLHYAALFGRVSVLSAIIEYQKSKGNLSIDAFNEKGFTALLLAAMIGAVDSFRLLIAEGADPNLPCLDKNKSPIQLAFKHRKHGIIKALLKNPKIDLHYTTSSKKRNIWHYAARYCLNRELLEALPQNDLTLQLDYKGLAPIHRAALTCNYPAIAVLKNREILTANGTSVVELLKLKNCHERMERMKINCIIS